MTLLDHYLRSVRVYLPRGAARADILEELAEHQQSRLDQREEAEGRRLSEPEQQEVLSAYGEAIRPTKDVDLLGFGDTSADALKGIFRRGVRGPCA